MSGVKPKIKFGTDGWRGIISEDFTFKNVRLVAQAIADYYIRKAKSGSRKLKIAVGYDTRFLSGKFAETVSEVLAQNGIDIFLSDRAVPTPTLSFAVKEKHLTAGVMITASHNPGKYNGIKIKTASGGAAGLDVTQAVERLILTPLPQCKRQAGKIAKADLIKDYVKFLRRYIDFKKLKNAKFRVLVDAMHGSGNSFLAQVLKGSKIKLEFLRADINPSFGGLRPEPVLENLKVTVERLKKEKFDLGLVLDGDADRIAAFAGNGEFLNPQKVLGLLMLHLRQGRRMRGGVVKTVVGTDLINNISKALGIKLYETAVGFKYISELMLKKDIFVGGEEAGGMGFKNYIPERDGSLAGLLLLEMMVYRKKSILKILNDMEQEFGRYYYLRDEIKLESMGKIRLDHFRKMKKILGQQVIRLNDLDGLKFVCCDGSWLVLRASGTEPIVRIYAESKNLARSKKLLAFGKKLILKHAV